MRPTLTFCCMAAMTLLAGLPDAAANSTTAVPGTNAGDLTTQLGRADFLTYCAACHGTGGKGDGTVAKFLTITAADLTQLSKKNAGLYPRERVTWVIDGRIEFKVHGPRDMPVWGDWFRHEAASSGAAKATEEEIVAARVNALAGYIETIQEK